MARDAPLLPAHIHPVLRPVAAALGAIAAAVPCPARPDLLSSLEAEQRALFERVEPSVVVVSYRNAISAGVVAAPGLVVTAAHGLAGAREVAVTFRDGRSVRAEVVASSPNGLDLALLRLPEAARARVLVPVARPALRAGDVVATIGHGDGSRWSFSTGMVSNPAADGANGALARLQLGVRPGTSGGPLVDRLGRLVGVLVRGDPGTVAYAVRSDAVLRALPMLAEAVAAREDLDPAVRLADGEERAARAPADRAKRPASRR